MDGYMGMCFWVQFQKRPEEGDVCSWFSVLSLMHLILILCRSGYTEA